MPCFFDLHRVLTDESNHLGWLLAKSSLASNALFMQLQEDIVKSIMKIAAGNFEKSLTEEFLCTFLRLSNDEEITDFFLQISKDKGDELEIGFFTKGMIADITLSNGKVYSCSYPLFKVTDLEIKDQDSKWVLTIIGEKNFDYNILKPSPPTALARYTGSLRRHLPHKN